MNTNRWFLLCSLFLVTVASGQNTISTIVGGGSPLGKGTSLTAMLGIPSSIVEDASGNIYVSGSGQGYVFKISGGNISILAGTGYSGIPGSGIPATTAAMDAPTGLALDTAGANLFISEIYSNHVFEVNLASGTLINFAGNTTASNPVGGYSGDGGPATQAALNTPQAIAFATAGPNAGTLYIADLGNNVIRAVAPGGTITTFAGNGAPCAAPPTSCGDNGPATRANLTNPSGVTVDASGNVFVADTGDNEIREIDTTGTITLTAGVGSACNTIPECGDGGPAVSASLNHPYGVFASGTDIYIADEFNQVVREVINGNIFSSAGTYFQGFSGDGGTPGSAELSNPTGVFVDPVTGDIFIADQGNNRIREVVLTGPVPVIDTMIGGGVGGDAGPPLQANFSSPFDVALDSSNNLYIVDNGTSRIREVSGGVVSTIAGSGTAGLTNSLGQPILNYPKGVVVAATGAPPTVYIADSLNEVVRGLSATLFTYAGTDGVACATPPNGCGDGGPAASGAQLNMPQGVALDANGNLYIADSGDNEIRLVSAGNISRLAGNGAPCPTSTSPCGDGGLATLASLNFPIGVAVDSLGNVYIADTFDNRIRKVDATTQTISTVAFNGNATFAGDGGPALSASMALPNKVVVDAAGNLFVGGGLDEVVQRVDAATQTVVTVAGVASTPFLFGFTGDGGPATSALLSNIGLTINSTAGLYIADTGNNRVRFVQLSAAVSPSANNLDFGNQTVNLPSTPLPLTLTNTGSDDLLISSITDANSFSQTNNCPIAPNPLAPAQTCTINVTFTPTGTGTATDTLTITDNATGSPLQIPLTGVGQTGIAIAPSPLNITQLVGTTSAVQNVTVTANGNTPVTIKGVALTGANASEFAIVNGSTTCTAGTVVEAGTSCNVAITFTPNAAGTPTATLTITDNVGTGTQTLPISGKVQNFSLTTTCTSLTVVPGQTAIYTVDLAPVNGFAQLVTLSCTGAPTSAACAPNPNSVTMDGTTTVQSKITATTTPPSSGFLQTPFGRSDGTRLAGLVGLAGMSGLAALIVLPGTRRTKQARRIYGWMFCLCLLSTIATLSSCGVGGGAADPSPTAAGTYPLTVTATFKSASGTTFTEKVGFNLVVQ